MSKDNFDQWRRRIEALKLIQPKRLTFAPGSAQSADHPTIVNTIGPAYLGDTDQDVLYLDNVSIEILGEVQSDGTDEVCQGHKQLFTAYRKAVNEYSRRHSNIIAPSITDLQALHGATPIPIMKK